MKRHNHVIGRIYRTRVACQIGLVLLALLGNSMFVPAVLSAEEQAGITLTPARLQITLSKGQQTQSSTVMVKNSYSQRVNFAATVHGVQQGSDGSLVPDVGPGEPPFKDVIVVTPATFSLDAGQAINLKVDLIDSAQLAPGGQYATLLVSQMPQKAENVRLTPAVAAGLFIVKEEGAVRQLTASMSDTNGALFRPSSVVDVTFRNTGNVPLTPRAVVRLTDPKGRSIAQGISNEESLTVMPGKELKLRSALQPLATSWQPGKYRVSVEYRYEGSDQTSELAQTQLVVPPKLVAIGGTGVIVGVLFIWLGAVLTKKLLRKRRRTPKRPPATAVVHTGHPQTSQAQTSQPTPRTTDGITKRPNAK